MRALSCVQNIHGGVGQPSHRGVIPELNLDVAGTDRGLLGSMLAKLVETDPGVENGRRHDRYAGDSGAQSRDQRARRVDALAQEQTQIEHTPAHRAAKRCSSRPHHVAQRCNRTRHTQFRPSDDQVI
jgi:hypothetical protein